MKLCVVWSLLFTAATAAWAQSAPVESVEGRLVLVFFDSATLTQGDQDKAIDAATRFVQNNTRPADRISVMQAVGGNVTIRQDFTNDREEVLTAIRQVSTIAATGTTTVYPSDAYAGHEVGQHLMEFQRVARLLQESPDRKLVIGFANSHSVVTDTVPQLKASIAIAIGAKVLVTRIAADQLVGIAVDRLIGK
jgi:hypothetical protein